MEKLSTVNLLEFERFSKIMADRDLVVACLHYTGELYDRIPWPIAWATYCRGDGFGGLTSGELLEINGGWDWSHVRDSSDDAIAEMAAHLRRALPEILASKPRPKR